MRQMLMCLASSLALSGAMADDNDWVYTPETHTALAPATAEGMMAGIDAFARGIGTHLPTTVDKWYWTFDWITGGVNFGTVGMCIIFK